MARVIVSTWANIPITLTSNGGEITDVNKDVKCEAKHMYILKVKGGLSIP